MLHTLRLRSHAVQLSPHKLSLTGLQKRTVCSPLPSLALCPSRLLEGASRQDVRHQVGSRYYPQRCDRVYKVCKDYNLHYTIIRVYSHPVMRLGKPVEHLQAALKAQAIADPILKITATIRQLGYALYLINDHLSWVGPITLMALFSRTLANCLLCNLFICNSRLIVPRLRSLQRIRLTESERTQTGLGLLVLVGGVNAFCSG